MDGGGDDAVKGAPSGLRGWVASKLWPPHTEPVRTKAERNRAMGRVHLAELNQQAHEWCKRERPQLLGKPLTTIDFCKTVMDSWTEPELLDEKILAASAAYLVRVETVRRVQLAANTVTLSLGATTAMLNLQKAAAAQLGIVALATVGSTFLVQTFVNNWFLDSHKDRQSKWKALLDELTSKREKTVAASEQAKQ